MSDVLSTCDLTETFLHLSLQQGFKTLFIEFCQLFKLPSLNWINLNDPTSGAALKYSDSTWLVMEGTGMVPSPWNQQCSVSWYSVHWLADWLTDKPKFSFLVTASASARSLMMMWCDSTLYCSPVQQIPHCLSRAGEWSDHQIAQQKSFSTVDILKTIISESNQFSGTMTNNEEEIFYSDEDISDSELYQVCSL